MAHAQMPQIESGLARGMVPYLYGASSASNFEAGVIRAQAKLLFAQATGHARLEQLSPTAQTFADWEQPARDQFGDLIAGTTEIPNDNLQWSALLAASSRQPTGGASGNRLAAPIGPLSKQSLTDANILKLNFQYGVPLKVPLAGRIMSTVSALASGCATNGGCLMYVSLDEEGQTTYRIPVNVSAQARMQSPARRSSVTLASAGAYGGTNTNYGLGQVGSASEFRPLNPAAYAVQPSSTPQLGGVSTGPSFLNFGGERPPVSIEPVCSPHL